MVDNVVYSILMPVFALFVSRTQHKSPISWSINNASFSILVRTLFWLIGTIIYICFQVLV